MILQWKKNTVGEGLKRIMRYKPQLLSAAGGDNMRLTSGLIHMNGADNNEIILKTKYRLKKVRRFGISMDAINLYLLESPIIYVEHFFIYFL